MVSIKDVARLAGVSATTVSRVINQTGKTSSKTTKRVIQAIEKLHYQPNLLARSLRSQKSKLLAFLVLDIESPVFARLAKYIEESASKKGYNLILCNIGENPKKEKEYLEILVQRQVEGIIFSRVSDESLLFKTPQLDKIPYVVLDRNLEKEEAPTVKLDNHRAGLLAAEHLFDLGHRRFACLSGPLKIKICRERLEGFIETLKIKGVSFQDVHIIEENFKIEGGKKGMNIILSLPNPPTAIFCMNDLMALGAVNAIHERHFSVPEDFSVVGLDNNLLSEYSYPPLTTVAQPFDQMAKEAINLLVKLIEGRKIRKREIILPPKLVVRSSTAPPKRAMENP
ncbi:MAG: LacI family DNA-binding transcriptional regulator [Candidatus Caldatribacteriaceae bacterium]